MTSENPASNEAKKQEVPRLDANDAVAIAGLALLFAGIFWIYRPAALIVLGVLLISYAWVSSTKPPQGK